MDWEQAQRYAHSLHALQRLLNHEIDYAMNVRSEPAELEAALALVLKLREELGIRG